MRRVLLAICVLALVGCAAPVSTAVPAPAPVYVTSADQIVGVWVMSGAETSYIRFNADGTFDMHENEAGLDDASVEGTYQFDGDKVSFEDYQLVGVGVYRLEMTEGGAKPETMRLRKVDDAAPERIETFTKNVFRRKN